MPSEGQRMDKIEKVLKDFSKKLPGLRKLICWERSKALKMNSEHRRLERHQIINMWIILWGLVPNPGVKWATESDIGRHYITVTIPTLKGKASVKTLREQSFQVTGPSLFNCVPKDIRNMRKCWLEDFKLRLDFFLTKEPDEPKGEGLIQGATNPFTGRCTNSLVDQVARRVSSWNSNMSGSYMDQISSWS